MDENKEIANSTWAEKNVSRDMGINTPNNIDIQNKNYQERLRYQQNTQHRDYLVNWVVITNSIWLIIVIIIVIAHGAKGPSVDLFNLSDKVIITLLGTTTVNVLGLAYIVLKGLFPPDKEM